MILQAADLPLLTENLTMLHLLSLRPSMLLAALLAAPFAVPLSAQMHWVDAAPSQSPAPRYGHAASSHYLMFGGRDDVQAFDDTWSYGTDGVNGATWIPVPTPVHPSARYDHEVAALVGGMMLFGGKDLAGNLLSDTWIISGGWVGGPPHVWLGGWQQQQSTASPTARTGHAMCYDWMTNSECVLFGGRTGTGLSNETWRFANGQWQQLSLAVAPTAREGHVLVADLDGWLLFGGEDANGVSSETWRFDGVSWAKLADMPFAAVDATAVYVSFERQRFSVVGGRDASGQVRTDAYERDRDGTWFNQGAFGAATARRDTVLLQHLHFVVNSPQQFRATSVVFGGRDVAGNVLGDTVRLEPTNVGFSQQISTGCGPGAWGNGGPDMFMQALLLGATRTLSVYTQTANTPVFVGAEFGAVASALPCQISINPAVILFGMATPLGMPAGNGNAAFPIHAPFDPVLRGAELSFQALAFDVAAVNGRSLSGVLVVRLGD
tara:strand:- start:6181 stop:7659 length:1479 start_codon:yes stop_codon:yes gene_type:complete